MSFMRTRGIRSTLFRRTDYFRGPESKRKTSSTRNTGEMADADKLRNPTLAARRLEGAERLPVSSSERFVSFRGASWPAPQLARVHK